MIKMNALMSSCSCHCVSLCARSDSHLRVPEQQHLCSPDQKPQDRDDLPPGGCQHHQHRGAALCRQGVHGGVRGSRVQVRNLQGS